MIKNDELTNIRGGLSKYVYGIGVGALVSFVIGLIDGYIRPLGCRK